MITMIVCSLKLKGPGLRFHFTPKVLNCRFGIAQDHPTPRG